MKKTILVFILLSIFITSLNAYRLNSNAQSSARWKKLPIKMDINSSKSGLSTNAVHTAISQAMNEWNTKVGKNIFLLGDEDTSISGKDVIKLDGRSVIGFSDNFRSDSGGFDPYTVVAIGGQFVEDGHMADAFILFNSEFVKWTTDTETSTKGSYYTDDLQTIATHELGHVIGLGHSEQKDAVMSTDRSQKIKRTLTEDDISGAKYLLSDISADGQNRSSLIGACGTIVNKAKNSNPKIKNTKENILLSLVIMLLSLNPLFILLFIRLNLLKSTKK